LVTRVEHDGQTSTKKKKKKEEVKNIETDDEDSASEESRPDSPARGGGDKVNQEEGWEEGENNDKGEVTLPKDPPTKDETSNKRKVSPQKPSSRKKTCVSKPKMKSMLTEDDVDLIIAIVEGVSEDILQHYGSKQETLYEIIEKELKEIQQAIHSSRVVPTTPSWLKIAKLGDEPTQLRRFEDETKARLQRAQEEKEKATESLKQQKEEVLEKL
jgi:hypothetical protein